ncbi:chloride channel-like protein 3 [Xylona heveae TC161]|uniref:Chloride channel protein n=1 Tax=Xylona heveae (strain CBS 132557 / TC161) TaxID=1328760 RepID=A0A165JQ44_XYLHT|nr:chloride channel-like protein 3 [Xylona heveae TC161]KZF26503.1 chloride channel-like protein 3 [Xylona heveae TC161]
MASDPELANERTSLIPSIVRDRRLNHVRAEEDSVISSHLSKEEQALSATPLGERLPYNDYTTIDWLHDLVKNSFRYRLIHCRKGLRPRLYAAWSSCEGWVAVALIGLLTACVAFLVDIAEATVSDWKEGYCSGNVFRTKEACHKWNDWTPDWWRSFGIYVGFALAFGVISSSLTVLLTKRSLPATAPGQGDKHFGPKATDAQRAKGKIMYMASGSGIPEIKTILSGFVIPHFLDFRVLAVKAVGAVFAVATGMCLGKEGPFVHISTCVGYLVGQMFPRYRENGRQMRELLSAACSAGLSVAFGAPIGGVLFSYEEISTYFPRKVLWRAFLCSMIAAVVLRALNPTGTGKLVLFETNYGTSYDPIHYLIFILLGIAGGLFGGIFCKANFMWSKSFRKLSIIRNYPVFETALVVLITALLQYPNPLTRDTGDLILKQLLVDCSEPGTSWVCQMESKSSRSDYIGWLVYGTLVKLVLTIVTFGCKVPSGIIIPALDAGAFFGRLMGQWITSISPGIFAMVGAAAFLAGVSRMTISLCVIMFELTGELEYVLPHMIAILVAKWVADALEQEGVYDLAQTVLGHPFLNSEHALALVRKEDALVGVLIPPKQTMEEITVDVPFDGLVPRAILEEKLAQLQRRGLMDAGLVLVQNKMIQGYLAEGELEFGLKDIGKIFPADCKVRLLGIAEDEEFDMSMFVDETPLTINENAPMEYAVEMFSKLGLRHLCVVAERSGVLVGVIIKKRLVSYLEGLKNH